MTRTAKLTLLLSTISAMAIGMSLTSCLPSPGVGIPAATEQPVAIHLTRTAEAAAVQTIEAALAERAKDVDVEATAQALARLYATQTAEAMPTATGTPTATSSPTPTSTPPPTPTPTPSCDMAAGGTFLSTWLNPAVTWRIGCPRWHEHVSWTAEQRFQHGYMLWRKDLQHIYVLHDDGTWQSFVNTWYEGQPVSVGYAPPSGLQEPVMGFGKIWREQLGGPDARIGWALNKEDGFDNHLQDFEAGVMFTSRRLGAGVIVVLYGDGHWEMR